MSVSTYNDECVLCEFVLTIERVDILKAVRDRSRYESHVLHTFIGLSHNTSVLQLLPDSAVSIGKDKAKAISYFTADLDDLLICFGSEQAAVKDGLNYENPGGNLVAGDRKEADNAVRLDLDNLEGETCLLNCGYGGYRESTFFSPNRNLSVDKLMGGKVNVVLLFQIKTSKHSAHLSKRLTLLENNEFIQPLLDD